MVNVDFETTTGAVCYHAQDIESVLCRCRNGSSTVRDVVFRTGATAYTNPLGVTFDIGLSLPVGINEGAVALDRYCAGDRQTGLVRSEGVTAAIRLEDNRTSTLP